MNCKDFSKVPVMWRPKDGFSGVIKQFASIIEEKYNAKINDYWDLQRWSIENIPEFWSELWSFVGVVYSRNYDQVVDMKLSISDRPEWFRGARLNFAENLLRFRDDRTALIFCGEESEVEYLTYAEVYKESCAYAAALRKFGLRKGDTAASYMSNRKEVIFAMLGVVSIGAIWMSLQPFYRAEAVVDRLKQVEPRILFTIDRFQYDREEKEMLTKVEQIAKSVPSLEKIVIVTSRKAPKREAISRIKNGCSLEDFLYAGRKADGSVPRMEFEQVSFSHPVFIIFSSGTKNLPKAIVHGSAPLLTIAKDFWIQRNSSRDNVWLTRTETGCTIWNRIVSLLFIGSTVVIFEGSPYFLSPTYLWDLVDQLGVTDLFLTAMALDELENRNYVPTEKHHLTSLKAIFSGSAVAKGRNYEFAYNKIKPGIIYCSTYGTTESMAKWAVFDYSLPVYKEEISAPGLGVEIKFYDESRKSLTGELGELVITKPLPSVPVSIWGDSDGSRFRQLYLSKYPGVFATRDLGLVNPVTNGIIIYGRSGDLLNPRGVLFGSSEIYNVVEDVPEVLDSICIPQYSKSKTERAVLFLKLQKGLQLEEQLREKIKNSISTKLSIFHLPEVILQIEEIPRSANGKKMEAVVQSIINNQPYSAENVINPECLPQFQDRHELQCL